MFVAFVLLGVVFIIAAYFLGITHGHAEACQQGKVATVDASWDSDVLDPPSRKARMCDRGAHHEGSCNGYPELDCRITPAQRVAALDWAERYLHPSVPAGTIPHAGTSYLPDRGPGS